MFEDTTKNFGQQEAMSKITTGEIVRQLDSQLKAQREAMSKITTGGIVRQLDSQLKAQREAMSKITTGGIVRQLDSQLKAQREAMSKITTGGIVRQLDSQLKAQREAMSKLANAFNSKTFVLNEGIFLADNNYESINVGSSFATTPDNTFEEQEFQEWLFGLFQLCIDSIDKMRGSINVLQTKKLIVIVWQVLSVISTIITIASVFKEDTPEIHHHHYHIYDGMEEKYQDLQIEIEDKTNQIEIDDK